METFFKTIALAALALVVIYMFRTSGFFGPAEIEKTVIESAFWRVTHLKKAQPSGGYEQFYRLYDLRNGAKMVSIGPPFMPQLETDFHAVVHSNTSDAFYSDCLVIVYQKQAGADGSGAHRLRSFWVQTGNRIKPL
jgi:hypothetical protein